MAEQDALKRICTAKNLVRCGFFSNTYHAEFVLNGEKAVWEIEYYRVPFEQEKEDLICKRYGLDKSSVGKFYSAFQKSLNQHLMITQELCGLSSEKVDHSTVYYTHRQQIKNKELKAIEVFEVRKPVEPLIGSSVISMQESYLSNVVQIGIRLLQMAKLYNDSGYAVGSFMPEGLYLSDETDKVYVKNGLFMNASRSGEIRAFQYSETAEPFMKPEVYRREEPADFSSDIYSACAVIWSMANGNYYTEKPDLQFPPRYADDTLTELLVKGMEGGVSSYKELNKGLRQYAQDLLSGEKDNPKINFQRPPYIDDLEEMSLRQIKEGQREKEEELKKEKERQESERRNQTKRQGKSKMTGSRAGTLLLIFLAIGFMLFMSLKTYFPDLFGTEEVVEATPEPTVSAQPVEPVGPEYTSEELGLYQYEDEVVNYDGTVNTGCKIDENGNITDQRGNIKVPKGYVEQYVYITSIRLNRETYSIQMERESQKDIPVGTCEVTVSVAPANATCKLVTLKLEDGNGTYFPYEGNTEYLETEFLDANLKSVKLKRLILDFSKSDNNSAKILINGYVEGLYILNIQANAGDTEKMAAVKVLDAPEIIETPQPTVMPTPTPVPTPAPTPYQPTYQQSYQPAYQPSYQPSYGGGTQYHDDGPIENYDIPSYPEVPAEPAYTEPEYLVFFTDSGSVTAFDLTMSVGENYSIRPSLSCTWGCSDFSVASIDGWGTVTALSPGVCTITAYSGAGEAYVNITVIE